MNVREKREIRAARTAPQLTAWAVGVLGVRARGTDAETATKTPCELQQLSDKD